MIKSLIESSNLLSLSRDLLAGAKQKREVDESTQERNSILFPVETVITKETMFHVKHCKKGGTAGNRPFAEALFLLFRRKKA